MMKKILFYSGILLTGIIVSLLLILKNSKNRQVQEASGVIGRVLPDYADQFVLKLIEKEGKNDVFEIEAGKKKIIIRGSSGVAICSGFNYYLKNFCNASYNWRCGNNMELKNELPRNFRRIRKVSPCTYRYIFNYCTFSYSMAFWDWEQWEKMIDWMALNGINMPLAPMGQEIIWQRVYEKHGITKEDLKDFFVGPAYNAFGRMGCIDGFAGPLPQSWIENENVLQKKILERERHLGMTPVLQGFTGHVPPALIKKNPGLKFTKLKWLDFPETFLLDWEDSLFTTIGKEFISGLKTEYGTDHYYMIDQFIEMTPAREDTSYLKNMSKTIFSAVDQADPEGIWVIQTWPFREITYWTDERTKAYFDGAPDNRMLALELMGESWELTGWHKHKGWYGKPWIWSVISNFGDNVSMFGGLPQITENYNKALSFPEKGNLSGMGLMNEGLDYNPVTYQLVADMMWEDKVPDLDEWKEKYLKSRYGNTSKKVTDAWGYIFSYYYTSSGLFERNPINDRPHLSEKDILPSAASVLGAKSLLEVTDELKNSDAFQYDVVNLFRQVFGQYAGHLLNEITAAWHDKNIRKFDESVKEFTDLSLKLEQLMGTREEFLLGKWLADSRKHATNVQEEKLYEWNARAIITIWGGEILYGYALKDWAGMYSSYYLPRWDKFFKSMRGEISGGEKLDYENFIKDIKIWEKSWVELHEENIKSIPSGNSIVLAKELWDQYGEKMLSLTNLK
jgi:alpha-N-acetylglucosaminidase